MLYININIIFSTNFFITASCDGHVKFWKKTGDEVEFVKHFRAHLGKKLILDQKFGSGTAKHRITCYNFLISDKLTGLFCRNFYFASRGFIKC